MKSAEYPNVQESMIDRLKHEGIVAFDVNLTQQEGEAIRTVHIENEPEDFDYYGSDAAEFEDSLRRHLQRIGSNASETLNAISGLIAKTVEEMKRQFQQPSAWTTVRVFLPSNTFDIPRWHADGHYVKDESGEFISEEYKLVFAPKGAPTRFRDFSVKEGQAVIYRVGERETNVHSEPEIKTPRIFTSTIVGSYAQIEELQRRFSSQE